MSVSTRAVVDVGRGAWSVAGGHLAVTTMVERSDHPGRDLELRPGVHLCDVSGRRLWRPTAIFRLEAVEGADVVPLEVVVADAGQLRLRGGATDLVLAWDGPSTLRVRAGGGDGIVLVETVDDPFDSAVAVPVGESSWRLAMGEDAHVAFDVVVGTAEVDGPRVRTGVDASQSRRVVRVTPVDGQLDVALTLYEGAPASRDGWRPIERCVEEVDESFAAWRAAFPPVPDRFEQAATHAAYVLWSSIAGPRGLLRRPAVLMSKNWMNAVWSWDHAVNAVGLAVAHPRLAWDQWHLPFDHQDPAGALPDLVHDAGWMRGFVKPPVHGWAARRLLAVAPLERDELVTVHDRLAAWTRWWLDTRDLDGDGLCEYLHGCDSGQDNSTAFDAGFPATAPDLAAYLVVQQDVLAELAAHLGDDHGAAAWRAGSDRMLDRMLDRLWDGRRFVVRCGRDGVVAPASRSVIGVLPLLLGARLPDEVRHALVDGLRTSRLLTDHGVATESIDAQGYEPDGYWRGPVWAPTTLLVVDGLRGCGEAALARGVAARFVRTCVTSGFAENFEATTGRPLRDPTYTWTASAFWTLLTDAVATAATP